MWSCSSCSLVFKNLCDRTRHVKSCEQIPHKELSQILPDPSQDLFPPILPHLPPTSHADASDAMDVDTHFHTNDPTTPDIVLDDNETLLSPTPSLMASWRGQPSDMPENPQTKRRNVVDLGHEARIQGDVRRHEAKMAKLWTNNNFRVLSQLMNSLSLSQSDVDRVLNAVRLHLLLSNINLCRFGELTHRCPYLLRTGICGSTKKTCLLPLECGFWTCPQILLCLSPLTTFAWFPQTSKWLA
jgi:hypothetical protein